MSTKKPSQYRRKNLPDVDQTLISIDMGKKKSLAGVDQKISSTNVNQKKLQKTSVKKQSRPTLTEKILMDINQKTVSIDDGLKTFDVDTNNSK